LSDEPAARKTYLYVDNTYQQRLPERREKPGGKEERDQNALDVSIDVLLPSREPRNLVVVYDRLPLVTGRGLRDGNVLADVDGDLLGTNASLLKARE
jgi:hypothetical protein